MLLSFEKKPCVDKMGPLKNGAAVALKIPVVLFRASGFFNTAGSIGSAALYVNEKLPCRPRRRITLHAEKKPGRQDISIVGETGHFYCGLTNGQIIIDRRRHRA
jgi:hypothetical protein